MAICIKLHKRVHLFKIVLLLLLSFHLYAFETLEIKDEFTSIDASPYIYFTNDSNNSYTSLDILNKKDLQKAPIGGQLKPSLDTFWSKLQLKNNANKMQNLVIYNKLPGINYIDVYIYKDNKLLESFLLGDMREQNQKQHLNRYSLFELILLSGEEVTIVSKVDNYNIHNISWLVETSTKFLQEESNTLFFIGIPAGFFLLFALINMVAYFTYRSIPYLIISMHTFLSLFYLLAINGVMYQLNLNINLEIITLVAWLSPMLGTSILLLFPYYFFNMKSNYPKFSIILKSLIGLNILFIFIHLFGFYVDEAFLKVGLFLGLLIGASTLFLFIVGLYTKEIGSKYFLIGQIILFAAVTLSTLGIFGVIPYYEFYRYLVTAAVSIDMVFLLLAQYTKTQHTLYELRKNKEMLVEQSYFSSIGYAIGNIAHQWKIPLAQVGTSFLLIETLMKHDQKNLLNNLEIEVPKISISLQHMKKSIEEFLNFYTSKVRSELFSPKQTIGEVMHILNSKIILKNVITEMSIDDTLTINANEHIFSNIMMILISNSLDEFEKNKENKIKISINIIDNFVQVIYKDNAGGIKIEPIEKVFDYFVSTKEQDGNGMGLAITKLLVEDKLGGSISVKNIDGGVEFEILIKQDIKYI
mgnify:CR=1 FL=1